jgi:hypothetical protein
MAEQENGQFVVAEVSTATGPPQLVDVSMDPRLANALRIYKDENQQKQMAKDTYEVRVVQVPGVLLEYLWYQSDTHQYMIPTLAASQEIDIGRTYEAQEFVSVLKTVAERFRSEQKKTKYPPPAPPPSQESKSK